MATRTSTPTPARKVASKRITPRVVQPPPVKVYDLTVHGPDRAVYKYVAQGYRIVEEGGLTGWLQVVEVDGGAVWIRADQWLRLECGPQRDFD